MEKELKDMTVREVLLLDEFVNQLQQVMDGEVFNQERAAQEAKKQGCRLGRTPLDRLREKQVWQVEQVRDFFGATLNKSLVGFGAEERNYIYLVGMAAFKRTVTKLQKQEKE